MQFALRVGDELCVGTALQDDSTPYIADVVEVLQEVNAVRDDDPRLGGKETVRSNNIV